MQPTRKLFRASFILFILASLLGMNPHSSLASGMTANPQALARQCLGTGAETAQNAQTGNLRFLGADAGQPIQWSNGQRIKSPELAARGYLSMCGSYFGLVNQADELTIQKQYRTDDGRSVVRFQQAYRGVPVFTGELLIQLDANNNILLVNGKITTSLNVDTRPRVTAAAAQREARRVVAENHQVKEGALTVSQAKLWVYDPALIGEDGAAALVWRVEVAARDGSPIRELVLVEAARGAVVLHFNQVDEALLRYTFTSNNTSVQQLSLVCDETDPTCVGGDLDAVNAHTYAGDTYNFYLANHNRDSIDNASMPLISTVHYGVNYCNAFWDGFQMTYGDGCFIVTDDVVAHELTHGVTQYESNLLYYVQSGAINESFSDIWGEFVDLGNGSGTDTPAVRWLIGEDVSTGAFRDMKNPPAYHQPDRMGHPYYYRGGLDRGGVHTNSGVGNKAAYLIVDGDTFNGYTVNGIGVTKAAKIYYEVQANILVSNSTYADLYNALYAACINLTGKHGITLADCGEVRKASQATEMNPTPPSEFTNCAAVTAIPASECDALVALYNATNGATGWNNKLNWLLNESPCNWLGVTCDASSPAHVISLALNANNLSGALPAEIANLASLQTLDLGDNPLNDEIPAAITGLASLTSLTLSCGPYTSNATVLAFLNGTIAGGWNCITISGNAELADVSLNLLDPLPKTFSADSSGNYIFSVTSNLPDLIITPFKQGYAFTPAHRTYASVTADQTAQDYAAIVDADPPTVLSVTCANPNPTDLLFVDFTVTFSEPVTGVDLGDFTLVPSGVSGPTLSGLSGSDASYTVTADTGIGNGSLRLDLPAEASIKDLAGNSLAALPYATGETYTIDRSYVTPFSSSATEDGWILEAAQASAAGGGMNPSQNVFRLGDNAQNKQYRSILSFDTSSLPDNAIIVNATIKIRAQGLIGTDPFSTHGVLYVDIRKGAFSGGNALQLSDFQAPASKSALATIPNSPLNGWYSKAWSSGIFPYINKAGVTQVRLRFKSATNNNGIADFIKFFSGNAAAGLRPQLIIEYKIP